MAKRKRIRRTAEEQRAYDERTKLINERIARLSREVAERGDKRSG